MRSVGSAGKAGSVGATSAGGLKGGGGGGGSGIGSPASTVPGAGGCVPSGLPIEMIIGTSVGSAVVVADGPPGLPEVGNTGTGVRDTPTVPIKAGPVGGGSG